MAPSCTWIKMSEKPGFIVKFYDKAYEEKGVIDLINAPVYAISGVSGSDAEKLEKALKIKTVADLATNEYVRLAQAITNFAQCTGQILDKEYKTRELMELPDMPVHAINGISEEDADLLRHAFNVETIRDLATNKYVDIAQTTVALAALVDWLVELSET